MRKLYICLAALLSAGVVHAADILHRYDFLNDVSDGVGNASGSLEGGAYVSGGALQLNGSGAYAALPAGIVSALDSVTIEAWVNDSGSANWARIFDFGSSTSTYMFLAPQAGGSGALRGAIRVGGGEQQMEWYGSRLPIGVPKHVVWTYDYSSSTGMLYVDGVLVAWNGSMTITPADMGVTTQNYLGKSQYNDPYFNGSIDELRIYDGALSSVEVEERFIAGPDLVPGPVRIVDGPDSLSLLEGRPASFQISLLGSDPMSIQWFRNGTPISGATSSVFSIDSVQVSDDGSTYYAKVTNLYDGSVYQETSATATLAVSVDNEAPELARVDAFYPDGVRVVFSEGVSPATATNITNYGIDSSGETLAITAAEMINTSNVLLTTAMQLLNETYTLEVSNVQDLASSPNTIVSPSIYEFIAASYVTEDIGNPSIGSSSSWVSGGGDITAAGSGIGGSSDQFSFSHKTYSGDFDVQIRISSLEFASAWSRAGLMARDGLDANDIFAAVFTTPGPSGCHFMSRSATAGTASMAGFFPASFPNMWLRLRRTGNLFEGFAGTDGSTWQRLGSATISMPVGVEIGLVLTSADPSTSITASFRDESTGGGTIVSRINLPSEPLGPSSRRGAMVISEIMVDAPSLWGGTNSLEFVELYNSGLITEDLTGHRFSGEIDYMFPDGTLLAPGQFLVVAKDPSVAQAFYGVDCLGPYDGKLSNSGGTLRFRNELDGILLEVEYDNKAPWPVAAFGTGHSMVLSHPSYGEGDARAWSASDLIGGSPGLADGHSTDSVSGVVINEYLAHTDLPQVDYVELFNTKSIAIDLSGAWLSDDAATLRYRIPDGTIIAPRGFLLFDQNQLGFALSADGEQIYLVNSNQTRVVDAVSFRGQANGVSEGRYPDGSPDFQVLSSVTEGIPNASPLLSPVVINEIMYHPISDSSNDEYIELYNRTGSSIDLSNWRLQGGVSYQFPEGVQIPANGYLVVAENQTNLIARYAQLDASNTFGNYGGKLGDGGDTIRLSMPEDLIFTNSMDLVVTNIYYIPVDEVSYLDGGRWGEWSDGGGSSLELIDPDADNRQPASWAESDESGKAAWTIIDVTDILENGQAWVDEGSPYGTASDADRLEYFLQGAGEVLVDDVEFLNNGGGNLVLNGDFSSGFFGWNAGGVARDTHVEDSVGPDGSDALHYVGVARGDTGCNKAYSELSSVPSISGSDTGTIRAKIRWLKGSRQILFRLRGNWMEASRELFVPDDCGTPGLVNSRRIANAGPAVFEVSHGPVLPAANEDVVVTARATDPDGVSSITLHYREDPSTSYSPVPMNDSGADGDAVAGDGIYSATISGRSAGVLVAFYIASSDGSASTRFPAAAERECLVRWGESVFAGSIGTYRLWVTQANLNFWDSREINANDTLDATFVYGDQRVVYNVDTMYSASPFHTPAYNGPIGSFACDYEINFHPGERFLGSEPFVLNAEENSGNFWFDPTTQNDLTGTWIARKLGQQYNYRRHVHMTVNGIERGDVYLDTQQPNGEMLDEYFPNDSQTELRKIESWFEFADNFVNQGSVYARIGLQEKSSGGIDPKWYRWSWRPRATRDHDNWFNFTNLVTAVNDSASDNWEQRVTTWMDVRNFFRPIATHHICGSWDSYAYSRGKNMYAFKPDNQGWRLLMWDIEISFNRGDSANAYNLYTSEDTALFNMMQSIPMVEREYLMAFQEAVDGPLASGVAASILNERYANLLANNVSVASPQPIIDYINARRSALQAMLPSATFDVDGPSSVTVATNSILLTGSAPLQVAEIAVNGIYYPVQWTTTAGWSMAVPLLSGTNVLSIVGQDRLGVAVPGASAEITVINSGSGSDPLDAVLINEWMADNDSAVMDPADGDYEDWFELYNAGAESVDLGGCYLTDTLTEPFEFMIPTNGHYVIPAGGYLLVWADGETSQNSTNQPDLHVSFSLSKSGEAIGLFAPDGREIDTVTFGMQTTDISEGRYPDGGTNIVVLPVATPGAQNESPSEPPILGEVAVDGSNLVFSWVSVAGETYQVYYKESLMDDLWISLGAPIPGTGGTVGFTNTITESLSRFYILEVNP